MKITVVTACAKGSETFLVARQVEEAPGCYSEVRDLLSMDGFEPPFVHFDIHPHDPQYPGLLEVAERGRLKELEEQMMYGDFEADPEGEAEYKALLAKYPRVAS